MLLHKLLPPLVTGQRCLQNHRFLTFRKKIFLNLRRKTTIILLHLWEQGSYWYKKKRQRKKKRKKLLQKVWRVKRIIALVCLFSAIWLVGSQQSQEINNKWRRALMTQWQEAQLRHGRALAWLNSARTGVQFVKSLYPLPAPRTAGYKFNRPHDDYPSHTFSALSIPSFSTHLLCLCKSVDASHNAHNW